MDRSSEINVMHDYYGDTDISSDDAESTCSKEDVEFNICSQCGQSSSEDEDEAPLIDLNSNSDTEDNIVHILPVHCPQRSKKITCILKFMDQQQLALVDTGASRNFIEEKLLIL